MRYCKITTVATLGLTAFVLLVVFTGLMVLASLQAPNEFIASTFATVGVVAGVLAIITLPATVSVLKKYRGWWH